MKLAHLAAIAAIFALSACDMSPEAQLDRAAAKAASALVLQQNSKRFTVTRVDVFKDSIAYGDRRGVYVITDNKTGKEYVGVSGVGISETGLHRSGKTDVADER
jgi:hypothetical protein